jgi:hypothetical protein
MLPGKEIDDINVGLVAETPMEAARGSGQLGVIALSLKSKGSVVSASLVEPNVLSGRI